MSRPIEPIYRSSLCLYIGRRIGILVLLLWWTAPVQSQEMAVPAKVQYPLFLKILTFDRNLKLRRGDGIVIGIVYQKNFWASVAARNEILEIAGQPAFQRIEGLPVHCVSINLDTVTLDDSSATNNVDVLYVAPLRAIDIGQIANVSRQKKMLSLTGVPEYVEAGLAIGIDTRGEKPLIVINVEAAKAEGSAFSSQLLKLAKLVQSKK